MRARLRWIAVGLWAAACVAAAWKHAQHPDNAPLFETRSHCAVDWDAELAPLRAALPERGVIGYAGPSRDRGCHPMFVAQYALAPLYLVEMGYPEHVADLAARQRHLLSAEPELVIVWGPEGQVWLQQHPDYRPVQRTTNAVLVWRAP